MDRNVARALAAFTSASSSPVERYLTHNSGKNAGGVMALLALLLLLLPDRRKLCALESGVRVVKEVVNPQRCTCCHWLAFQSWEFGLVSDKAANPELHAENALKRSVQSGWLSGCSSSVRQVVSLLDGCGVKRFSNKEALLWSPQRCFCLRSSLFV